MISRRQFALSTAAGLILPGLTRRRSYAAPINGVRVGVQTYSFRELPRAGGDAVVPIVNAMKVCGLDECELWSPQIEPAQVEEVRSCLAYVTKALAS